jgi:Ca-activated chloride channel family protein
LPKSVFDADTVQVFALFSQPPRGELTLSGQRSRRGEPACIGRASLPTALGDTDTVPRIVAQARLEGLSAAEATSLAVAYQLITPRTNFLLPHQRATADKADDIPELHAVKHMHPAGWGGAGSVLSVDEPTLKCIKACSGAMEAPTLQSPMGPDYLDVPAFLRRQSDATPAVGDRVRNFLECRVNSHEPEGPLNWDDEDETLTPRGLLTYLTGIPQEAWPRTYTDLRDLGLEPEIVDWLEEIFASEYPSPLAEQQVIESFLRALLDKSVYRRIMNNGGPLQRLRQTLKQAVGRTRDPGAASPDPLVDDLVAYMRDIEADVWPEAMKAEPLPAS